MLFKHHELKVQMVKTDPTAAAPKEPREPIDLLMINYLIQDNVRRAAILVGIGYAAKKVLDTATELSILTTASKLK